MVRRRAFGGEVGCARYVWLGALCLACAAAFAITSVGSTPAIAAPLATVAGVVASGQSADIPPYPRECATNLSSYPAVADCLIHGPFVHVSISPRIVAFGQTISITMSTGLPACTPQLTNECYSAIGVIHERVLPATRFAQALSPNLDHPSGCVTVQNACQAVSGGVTERFKVEPSTFDGSGTPGGWVAVAVAANMNVSGTGLASAEAAFFVSPNACPATVAASLDYKTGKTLVHYRVDHITRGCKTLELTANRHHIATISDASRSSSGVGTLDTRECTVKLELSSPTASAGVTLGDGDDGKVFWTSGDPKGPDGETLRKGDPLCAGEHGAGYRYTPIPGSPGPSATPIYAGYFADVESGLEQHLQLHVDDGSAIWFLIGSFGAGIGHGDCPPTCNYGEGTPIEAGGIVVPSAHINLLGTVTARSVTLGLGNGRTASITPPQPAPSEFFPGGQNPVIGKPNLEVVAAPTLNSLPCTGFVELPATRATINGKVTLTRCAIGANGQVTIDGDVDGTGAIAALGNITIRGPIDVETDLLETLTSPGDISLLGAG